MWANEIASGRSSLAATIETIASSDEATQVAAARTLDEHRTEAAIAQIYELALQRPSSHEERRAWVKAVMARKMDVSKVLEIITSSEEARQTKSARATDVRKLEAAIVQIYELVLHRTPQPEERQVWVDAVVSGQMDLAAVLITITASEEATQVKGRVQIAPEVPNGRLVQFTYELLLGRGAMAAEILHWDERLRTQNLGRDQFVLSLFGPCATQALSKGPTRPIHDPGMARIMGTDKFIDVKNWGRTAGDIPNPPPIFAPKPHPTLRLNFAPSEIVVSAIASLYKGGAYIKQFLENITSQSIFANSELIIIDANSPESEFDIILPYLERFPNIIYHRAPNRIGIYEAWNLGVHLSRGRYLTNTNLDDLRRFDSLERQAEALENMPFVDVVYQDFFYSFDGHAIFDLSAAVGIHSELPIITPYNLMQSNSPHNAPMWRRTLHSDLGLFNDDFQSAGDYEFWLRCCLAGKTFFKLNDPHVVYFVNPEGLSTQPDTRGFEEANQITKEYARRLISKWVVTEAAAFIEELSSRSGIAIKSPDLENEKWDWRYKLVQHALRQHSIQSRLQAA